MAVLTEIGIDQIEMGSNADAESSLERAITLIGRQQRRPTPLRADALVGLGRVRLGLGRPSDALAPLREADAFWSGLGEGGGRWGGEAALWLGRCYAALGREAEGRAADSRARTSLSRSPLPADARLLRLVRPG
jgi:tetratricopeptide (TPR) repeat protein